MRAPISYRAIILWVVGIAVSNTVTAHITRTNMLKTAQDNQTVPKKTSSTNPADTTLAVSAPYRDGLFMARISQQRGEISQPPIGRWSTSADRSAFVAGYASAYKTTSTNRN